jgi:3-oxoacyl-[acyl-carrier protein] reductase
MNQMLAGKVALITGSARGIGRATAELFVQYGARVAITDIDPQPLEETRAAIAANGGEVEALPGDITSSDFPQQLIDTTLLRFGTLDILVNNAGYTWDGALHNMTDGQWQAILDVHLTAPFRLLRAAAPFLRETAKREQEAKGFMCARKIVNISSTSGTRGNAGQANYAAAKAGILGLTKTTAREWGRFNVQANAVAFGWIDTRLAQARENNASIVRGGHEIRLGIPAARRNQVSAMIPLGRPGTALEAAGAVLFFASPLSDFVSGQVLEVTGGL